MKHVTTTELQAKVPEDYTIFCEIYAKVRLKLYHRLCCRCEKEYWQEMRPTTGRPMSTPFCEPMTPASLVNTSIMM